MEFCKVCRVTLTILFYSGLYLPAIHTSVYSKNQILFSKVFGKILSLAAPLYSTSLTLPMFSGDESTMDRVFCFLSGLVTFAVVIKQYLFNRNVSRFEKLIKVWDEINKEDFYPQLRDEMLRKRKRTTDAWSIAFGFILVSVVIGTSLVPFVKRKLQHLTAFPYSEESPQFEILCVYELLIISSMCFLVNGYNCFFMQIIAFEDVLCNYLKLTLENIVRSLNVSDGGKICYDGRYNSPGEAAGRRAMVTYKQMCAETERKMRTWIGIHQKLIRYNEAMREIYQLSLCVDFVGLIMTIGLTIFLFVSGSLNAALIFNLVAYSITAYTLFYVTCYYGDMTELSSGNLFHDAFDKAWYIYPRKIRIAYFFILMRCRKPLIVSALNFYPLNSRSFGTIFNHSYSFLMFLLQVSKRSK